MQLPSFPEVPLWKTLDEAAEREGVSRATIYRWIKAGLVRRYRIYGDPKTYVNMDEIKKLRTPHPKDDDETA